MKNKSDKGLKINGIKYFRLPFGVIFIILSFFTGFAIRLGSLPLGELPCAELQKLEILLQNG